MNNKFFEERQAQQEGMYYYYKNIGTECPEIGEAISKDYYRFPMSPNNDKQEAPRAGSSSSSMASSSTATGYINMGNPMDHSSFSQPALSPTEANSQTPSQMNGNTAEEAGKKRKRTKKEDGEPSEPRRLRRSHEACARCRSKKIKCDSKHPRCTACQTANSVCEQEDRHRQTLTPRGYTEGLEQKLAACERLLANYIPNFQISDLEAVCARHNINISTLTTVTQPTPQSTGALYPHTVPSGPHSPVSPVHVGGELKGVDPHSNDMSQPGQSMAKSFGVHVPLHAPLPRPPQVAPTSAPPNLQPILRNEDLSVGSASLSSGRDRHLVGPGGQSRETPRDAREWTISILRRASLVTGQSPTIEIWLPKDLTWTLHVVDVYFERLNIHRPVFDKEVFIEKVEELYAAHPQVAYNAAQPSAPGQDRESLPQTPIYDEGFICSFFLVLALGTLSEANYCSDPHSPMSKEGETRPNGLPDHWPKQEEFFSRALSFKPDLRVTLSSLQALILLHWYLYCELQGRNLWRLVGSLVRLGVELGLHHDPYSQYQYPVASGTNNMQNPSPVFSTQESALRIRLWSIVLIHDRATSSLLGRPLAVSPNDINSPIPKYTPNPNGIFGGDGFADFSPHFQYSHDLASIQADIVISLYSPNACKNTDGIIRNATRIMKSLADFRRRLGPRYQKYFRGSARNTSTTPVKIEPGISPLTANPHRPQATNNPMEDLTEDEGLTLLKVGFTRILLLRAIFGNKELDFQFRMRALTDAISTAHNTIHIHNQLISFPSIAFFTSPIPLHINAMVILTGHIWQVRQLERHVAVEDVWLALDMLPRFRWRWERKDWGGEHPFLARLVELTMSVDLSQIIGCSGPPVLIEEREWGDDEVFITSPSRAPSRSSPLASGTVARSPTHALPPQSSPLYSANGSNDTNYGSVYANPIPPAGPEKAVEVPNVFFYPFFPGQSANLPMTTSYHQQQQTQNSAQHNSRHTSTPHITNTNSPPDINAIFMHAAASQPDASYGYQPSQETFFSEERDSEAHQPPQQPPQPPPQAYSHHYNHQPPPAQRSSHVHSSVPYSPTNVQHPQHANYNIPSSHVINQRPSLSQAPTVPPPPSNSSGGMVWLPRNSSIASGSIRHHHTEQQPQQQVHVPQSPQGGRGY